MRLCVVSGKECWENGKGVWVSSGGFPRQMTALASLFETTTLVVRRGPPKSGGLRLPAGALVIPLPRPKGDNVRRKVSALLWSSYYLPTVVRQVRRADAVHLDLPGDLPLLGLLVALAFQKPLVARYCGSWRSTVNMTLMGRATRALMRRFAGGRNVMLATGEDETPPASGMHWIFATAVSMAELGGIDARVERLVRDPPRLVFLGRLAAVKGVDVLLRAVAILRAGPSPLPVSLTVVGDGPERHRLERLVKELSCRDAVEFVGQVDRQGLGRHLRDADLCVLPSLSEGYCKALLDAFAYGVPVVASDVGAAGRVVGQPGERGWLVPPGDVEALAATLRRVLTTNSDWPPLRQRCRAYAESLTLETWSRKIGERCAQYWGAALCDGKLQMTGC